MEAKRRKELELIVIDYINSEDDEHVTEGIYTPKEMAFCITFLDQCDEGGLVMDFCFSVLDSSSE